MKIRKIMIVLYAMIENTPHYILFLNREFNEWAFLSGTCKKREGCWKTAMRELKEETKGIFTESDIDSGTLEIVHKEHINCKQIPSWHCQYYKSITDLKVHYSVFFLQIHLSSMQIRERVRRFEQSPPKTKNEEENISMRLFAKEQLYAKNGMRWWPFLIHRENESESVLEILLHAYNSSMCIENSCTECDCSKCHKSGLGWNGQYLIQLMRVNA